MFSPVTIIWTIIIYYLCDLWLHRSQQQENTEKKNVLTVAKIWHLFQPFVAQDKCSNIYSLVLLQLVLEEKLRNRRKALPNEREKNTNNNYSHDDKRKRRIQKVESVACTHICMLAERLVCVSRWREPANKRRRRRKNNNTRIFDVSNENEEPSLYTFYRYHNCVCVLVFFSILCYFHEITKKITYHQLLRIRWVHGFMLVLFELITIWERGGALWACVRSIHRYTWTNGTTSFFIIDFIFDATRWMCWRWCVLWPLLLLMLHKKINWHILVITR